MTAITFPAHGTTGTGLFRTLSRLAGALHAAIDAQHDYQRLQILSDRRLAALGFTREDLPQIVFDRHFR